MNSGVMILIGVIFILISIVFLASHAKKEKAIYDEILEKYNDIKEYSNTIEQIVDNLDKLIDSFLTRYNNSPKDIVKSGPIIDYKSDENESKSLSVTSNYEKDIQIDERIDEIKSKEEDPIEDEKEDVKEDINKTIINLKKQGLSNQEIAKKLSKGIREIDIITKMIKLKDGNSFD